MSRYSEELLKRLMGAAVVFFIYGCVQKTTDKPTDTAATNTEATDESSDDDGPEDGGTVAPAAGKMRVNMTQVGPTSFGLTGFGLAGELGKVGNGLAAEIAEMSLFISEIKICESAVTSGTAVGSLSNCLKLYASDGAPVGTIDEAKLDTTNYVNLVDSAAVAEKFNSEFTLLDLPVGSCSGGFGIVQGEGDDGYGDSGPYAGEGEGGQGQGGSKCGSGELAAVGEYTVGQVQFSKPIKIKAAIPLVDGSQILYTKDGAATVDGNGNSSQTVASISTSPAETAVVQPALSGIFYFNNPVAISSAAIAANKEFVLDLVYAVDGSIKGYKKAGGHVTDGTYAIEVMYFSIIPVFHEKDDNVVRESYLLEYSGADPFNVQVDLYYVDSAATNILAANATTLFTTSSTTGSANLISQIQTASANADGSINLIDFTKNAVIRDIPRLATVGATGGTATICAPNGTGYIEAGACTTTYPLTTKLIYKGDLAGSVVIE